MSISPKEARKKLDVVQLFVLADLSGKLYEVKSGDEVIIPAYMRLSDARKQATLLKKSLGSLAVKIQTLPMSSFLDRIDYLRPSATDKGVKLKGSIIVPESEKAEAVNILVSEGFNRSKAEAGIKIPVFYAKPMLAVDSDGAEKGIFYFSYSQIGEAVKSVRGNGSDAPRIKAADLYVILDMIIKEPEDKFVFAPTSDYMNVMRSVKK